MSLFISKLHSRWIKGLTVGPETIKPLEENIGRTLFDINRSNIWGIGLLRQKGIKAKINKWDLIKLKILCTEKETVDKTKDDLQNGRKYL